MKKIHYNVAINITSNSDEWCNLSKPLFDLERHTWFNDGQEYHYAENFASIGLALENEAIRLAKAVTVEQLNDLAKEADENGWSSIELYNMKYDEDFFDATIVVEALADDEDEE